MDNTLPPMVTRFGQPSKMDTSPFGTICKVSCHPNSFDIYLQISHDENEPNWTCLGSYNSDVADQHIHDQVQKILLSPSNN